MSVVAGQESETESGCRWSAFIQPRGISLIVLGMMAVNLAFRFVAAAPGYFWQDDYYITAWAEANPLGPRYLLLPFSDHFQPLGLGMAWVSQWLFPGSYAAATSWTAVVYAASIWVFYRLLVRLYGWRPQFFLVLLVWSFSVFTLQTYLWYSSSLWVGPYLLLVPLALLAAVSYLANPAPWRLALAFLASALAVSAHTFGLAVPVLTAMFLGVMGVGSAQGTAWWRCILSQWRLLLAQSVPLVLVVFFYIQRSAAGEAVTFEPVAGLMFAVREFVVVVIPGLAGGPWRYNGYLSPEFPLFTLLGGALVIEFVVLLVWLYRAKVRAFVFWMCTLVVVAAQLYAVTLGRGGGDTSLVIRYAAPGLIVLCLAASYTVASRSSEVQPWRGSGDALARWWRSIGGAAQGVIVVCLAQAYVISFGISAFTPILESPFIFNRTYMTELKAQALLVPPGTDLLPQFVPNRVVGVNAPGPTSTQLVLANLPVTPSFANVVSGDLWGFTERGELVRQVVWGVAPLKRSDSDCVVRINGDPLIIPLEREADYWYATVSLGTLSPASMEIQIDLLRDGQPDGTARFGIADGLQRTYAPLPGSGDAVRLTPLGADPLCVTDLVIGERFHERDGEWVQDPASLPTQDFRLPPPAL